MPPRPQFLVGTASWTDPTLVKSDVFYPRAVKTAEDRLRFYAEQFNTVEVDSTYYALPAERNAKLWAERTPEGFVFNIKPFALMTQHPAEISRLPKQLRGMLPADEQSNRQLTRPSKEIVDMAFQMFWSAMAPLREAGKLGIPAFQFPPYFILKPANFDYLASLPERLPGVSIAIEFRHPSWVRDEVLRSETMNFLRSHGLYYTSIDAPEDTSIVPSFIEVQATRSMFAFMARTARTGSNATSRRPSDSSICIRNASSIRSPKGSAICRNEASSARIRSSTTAIRISES